MARTRSLTGLTTVAVGALLAAGCNLGSPPVRHPGPSRALVIADVDGDGHPDRVSFDRSSGRGTVLVAPGDGTGAFGPEAAVPDTPDFDVLDVALADVDDDGVADLVEGGTLGARVRRSGGSGAFETVTGVPCHTGAGGGQPSYLPEVHEVTAGDVDLDGDVDIVEAGFCVLPDGTRVMSFTATNFNDGTGVFRNGASQHFAVEPLPVLVSPRVADVNEDGRLDNVVVDRARSIVLVMLYDRWTGTIRVSVPVASNPGAVAVKDLDLDGHVDLVVTSPSRGMATVLYGDGTGAFPERHTVDTGASSIDAVEAGDLDGDGRVDLVFGTDSDTGAAGPGVVVMRNTLDGRGH